MASCFLGGWDLISALFYVLLRLLCLSIYGTLTLTLNGFSERVYSFCFFPDYF